MKKSDLVTVCLMAGVAIFTASPASALTALEQAKLLASDGAATDIFGSSAALDGDTVVIGARGSDSNGSDSGSAYVFTRTGDVWTEQGKLLASDGEPDARFGRSVALSGDTAIIGAHFQDNSGTNVGAAYVFTRTAGVWTQQAKLVASDGSSWDYFGESVALDGDTAIIGAPGDGLTGSAYVFARTGNVWTEGTKLLASDGATGDLFGFGAALDGDTAIVGATWDDDNGESSGSAYVFTRTGNVWTEQAKLLASDGSVEDRFGEVIALDGDTAVVGVSRDDDNGESAGSAYVFTRTGNEWTEQAKLLASDGMADDYFGEGVGIDGDTAIVSAMWDGDNGLHSGSAYAFTRAGDVWTEQAKLLASDGVAGDVFGASAALDGDTVIVGASGDDDNGPFSGSAYVFRLYGDDIPAAGVVGTVVLVLTVLGAGAYFVRRPRTG